MRGVLTLLGEIQRYRNVRCYYYYRSYIILHSCSHSDIYTDVSTRARTHIHTHTLRHALTYTHTHTHTHTHTVYTRTQARTDTHCIHKHALTQSHTHTTTTSVSHGRRLRHVQCVLATYIHTTHHLPAFYYMFITMLRSAQNQTLNLL